MQHLNIKQAHGKLKKALETINADIQLRTVSKFEGIEFIQFTITKPTNFPIMDTEAICAKLDEAGFPDYRVHVQVGQKNLHTVEFYVNVDWSQKPEPEPVVRVPRPPRPSELRKKAEREAAKG